MEVQGPRIAHRRSDTGVNKITSGAIRKISCVIFKGSLYSKEKECPTAAHINLDKSQKHRVKKQVTKE